MSKIRWKSLNKKSSFKWALLTTLLLPFATLLNNHQAQALPANYNMGDFKNLAFHAPLTNNGVSQLPADITINGTTVSPSLRCEGKDATASNWACTGDTLSIAGTGPAPTLGASTPFTDGSEGVDFNGGQSFSASSITVAQIDLEDFAIEFVLRAADGAVSNARIFSNQSGSQGFTFNSLAAGSAVYFTFGDAATSLTATITGLSPGAWHHLFCAVNRDEASLNGVRCYVNGVFNSASDFSTIGSAASAATVNIGATASGAAAYEDPIAFVSQWRGMDLFSAGATGAAEMAAIASERFNLLTGITDIFDHTVTASRSSTAMSSITDSTCTTTELFNLGSNWTRTDCACDKNGERICGARVEPSATNLTLQSQTFDNAYWFTYRASITANTATAPDGTSTMDTLGEDGTAANTHYTRNTTQSFTSGTQYTYSVFVKAINRNWIRIDLNDTTTNHYANFDVSNGAVDTTANIDDASIIDFGNGLYRCSLTFTAAATTTSGTLYHYVESANNTTVFDGLSQDSLYLWGAQLEAGAVATSYIPTTTATVTRAADILRWAFAAPSTGTIRVNVFLADYSTSSFGLFSLSDGTNNNRMRFYISNQHTDWYIAAGAVAQARIQGVADFSDGAIHALHERWSATLVDSYLDRASQGTPDTSATIPTTTTLYLGNSTGFITAPMLISDFHVYNKQRTPRVVPVFHAPLTTDETDLFGHTATFSRSTTATQSVIDETCTTTTLSTVAANTLRIDCACDKNGERLCGARVEPAATNLVLQSQAFDDASWTKTNTTITANSTAAPDGTTTADTIAEAATAPLTITQVASLTSGTTYTLTRYVKQSNRSWFWLRVYNASDADNGAWFNSADCSIGTVKAGATATAIEDLGGGWCRASMTFVADVTATYTTYIYIGSADNTWSISGLSQDSLYLWGAQLEAGPVATSYIPTTTATVTRAADILRWAFAAPSTGTIRYRLLVPDFNNSTDFVISLSDGTSNNRIQMYMYNATDAPRFIALASSVAVFNILGTTDISSNQIFTLHQRWSSTNNDQFVDRISEGTPDTSATIPTTTTLYLGHQSGGITAPMLISDLRVDNGQVLR